MVFPQEVLELIAKNISDFESFKNFLSVFEISDFTIYKFMANIYFSEEIPDEFLRKHLSCLKFLQFKDFEKSMMICSIQKRAPDIQMGFYNNLKPEPNWTIIGMEYGYSRFTKVFPFPKNFKHIRCIQKGKINAIMEEIIGT